MSAVRTVDTAAIDALIQCSDDLRVLWLALTNKDHADEYLPQLAETAGSIATRVEDICDSLRAEPVRMVGGDRCA